MLLIFATCVAPIAEEHDTGLCRVTGILNAIYVAETGYVRPRVRIFVFELLHAARTFAPGNGEEKKGETPRTYRRTRAASPSVEQMRVRQDYPVLAWQSCNGGFFLLFLAIRVACTATPATALSVRWCGGRFLVACIQGVFGILDELRIIIKRRVRVVRILRLVYRFLVTRFLIICDVHQTK